jgi:FkbM family methyltransferase
MTTPYRLIEHCRYGRFLTPPRDLYMGRALDTYGEYSELELDCLRQLIQRSGGKAARVISCGANMGAFIVPLAQVAGEVICFEPVRHLHQICAANIALNGLTNVRLYWAAVGAEPGTVRIPMLRMDMEGNYGGFDLHDLPETGAMDDVPIMRLDDIPNTDGTVLLAMDIEGMEPEALQGAQSLIATRRPFVFFEAEREINNALMRDMLAGWKYHVYWYQTPHFNPNNWRAVPTDVWADADGATVVTTNALAIPAELGTLPLPVMEPGRCGDLIPGHHHEVTP